MKSIPLYEKRGYDLRISTFANGENPDPQTVCPTGNPTLKNAFLKGWHSITGVRLEVEARVLTSKNTVRSLPRGRIR